MAFTQDEEDVLRLMVAELRTRQKLNIQQKAVQTDIDTNVSPLSAQIIADNKATTDALKSDYDAAFQAIEDKFKV